MSDWQMIRLAPPLPKAKPRKPVAVINQAQADLNEKAVRIQKLVKEIQNVEYSYTYEITRDKWDEPEFVKKNIDDRSGFGGAFLPPDRDRPVSRVMQRTMDSKAMTTSRATPAQIETKVYTQVYDHIKEFRDTIDSFFKNVKREEPVRLDGLTDYMRHLEEQLCDLHAVYGSTYPKLFRDAEQTIVTYYERAKADYEAGLRI